MGMRFKLDYVLHNVKTLDEAYSIIDSWAKENNAERTTTKEYANCYEIGINHLKFDEEDGKPIAVAWAEEIIRVYKNGY